MFAYVMFLWCAVHMVLYQWRGESLWHIPVWVALLYVYAYIIAVKEAQ